MRPFLVCVLAAVLPAACLAHQEPVCEDGVSHRGPLFGRPAYHDLLGRQLGWVSIRSDILMARIEGTWDIE